MGREGSWWILLGSLSRMGLLLATLEARSWSWTGRRSLGGGRRVVLKLLLLWLWRARLRGSGLRAVSCRKREQGKEGVFLIHSREERKHPYFTKKQLPFFLSKP